MSRKKTRGELVAEIERTGDSLLAEVDTQWQIQPATNFQSTALTYLMRRELENLEQDEQGEPQTVAQGLVRDVIKRARGGNATAMTIVFDRMEGKVPNTSVNVNATFTDDERVARVLDLIKRGRGKASAGEPAADGQGGA